MVNVFGQSETAVQCASGHGAHGGPAAPGAGARSGAAAGSQLSTSSSRCDQGGPDNVVGVLQVNQGDLVNLRIVLCQAAFRVSVNLDTRPLLDQDPFPGDEVDLALPPLAPGVHHLTWGYLAAGSTWSTLSEVSVKGVVGFRQRSGSASGQPFNFSSVALQVRS